VEQTDWFGTWECLVTADDGGEPGEAGSATVVIGQNCDIDGDLGVAEACGGDDCDDDDPTRFAAQTETCNGIDDDCDDLADVGAGCPCPVQVQGGHSYLFCETELSWSAARDACLALDYDLATIETDSENTWLYWELFNYSPPPEESNIYGDRFGWWLGYNDRVSEGTPEWASGSPATFEADYYHTDNKAWLDCNTLGRYVSFPVWAWRSCSDTQRYVCENLH
jgi:hypothetical protein